MRWLIASTATAGILGTVALASLGPAAWPFVVPLAGLAAAPLLPRALAPGIACGGCRAAVDPQLDFCGRCAAPL